MSIETIYIDSSDEITSVIERLKASHEPIVALVVPKGAVLTQSIVNLKLAKKAAGDSQKDLILVTTDKIGRNLATQVGINVASSEKDVANVAKGQFETNDEENASVIAGVRIHRYYDEGDPEEQESAAAGQPVVASPVAAAAATTPIVPKTLLQDSSEAAPTPLPVEITAAPQKGEVTPEPIKRTKLADQPEETALAEEAPSIVPAVVATKTATTESGVTSSQKLEVPTKQVSGTMAQTIATKGGFFSRNRRPLSLVGGIVLVISLLASFFFLPTTTVTLTVQAKPWEQEFLMVGSPSTTSIASSGTAVPAERLSQEGEVSASFPATGTKRVGNAAKGSATIFNSQDSASQTLPAGAKLEANGRSFTTDAAVTVPGVTVVAGKLIPGSASVAITADNVGPESNVSNLAANITSPSTNLYAQIESTSGGSSQELKVVAPADITNAKNTLAQQLREDLTAKLTELTANRDTIFQENADLLSTPTFTTSLEVNAEGESFTATSKATLERLIIDKVVFTEAVEAFYKNTETSAEKRLIEASEAINPISIFDTETLTITAKASGKITPIFNSDNLPGELVGKSLTSGQDLISQATPASNVTITQSPSWWPLKQFPRFAGSITIKTTYE